MSDENNLMRTEIVDTISLFDGLHAFEEHKFRRNIFNKDDSIWYFPQGKTQIFYDYVFTTAKIFTTFNSHKLATIDFSLDATQLVHERVVQTIVDWISALGGVFEIFLVVLAFIVGGYSGFSQTYQIIHNFHSVSPNPDKLYEEKEDKGHKHKHKKGHEGHQFELSFCQKIKLYLIDNPLTKKIFCCFNTPENGKTLADIKKKEMIIE